MEDSTVRKIMSVVGLAIAAGTIGPVSKVMANLHGHTTSAAIWTVFFLVGMVVAWVSVTSTSPMGTASKPMAVTKAAAQKAEGKGNMGNLIAGILMLAAVVFFYFVSPSYILGSTYNTIGSVIVIICGILLIVFSRPAKKK